MFQLDCVISFLLVFCVNAITARYDSVLYSEFLTKYNRSYENNEFTYRYKIFQASLRRQEWLNSGRVNEYDAWYGVNQFSDLTPQEFQDLYLTRLSRSASKNDHNGLTRNNVYSFSKDDYINVAKTVPQKFDWREKGVIGAVRNQLSCGACWAFAVVETITSVLAIQNHTTPKTLSAQQLVDCAANNNGCKGGDTCRALEWLLQYNISIVAESDYPFKAKTQQCIVKPITGIHVGTYECQSYTGNEDGLVQLVSSGPVAVAVDASTWQDYMGGIIQYHCDTYVNHAVQIVGYDLTEPVPHYIVRNQWGSDWGRHGYLLIGKGKNLCGIASEVASVGSVKLQ